MVAEIKLWSPDHNLCMTRKCASTVVGVKKNCGAILVIVAAGRQFMHLTVAEIDKCNW